MSEDTSGGDPVVVAQFPAELEAGFAASKLRDAGIECRTIGGHTAGFRAEAPGMVSLMVHARDAERAGELLADGG